MIVKMLDVGRSAFIDASLAFYSGPRISYAESERRAGCMFIPRQVRPSYWCWTFSDVARYALIFPLRERGYP